MPDTSTFGTLIRERRLEKGLSLGQLATQVGHTAASVRRWERGEDTPSPALITRLAEVLELEPESLTEALTASPATGAAPAVEEPQAPSTPLLPWESDSDEPGDATTREDEAPAVGGTQPAAPVSAPAPAAAVEPAETEPTPSPAPAAATPPEAATAAPVRPASTEQPPGPTEVKPAGGDRAEEAAALRPDVAAPVQPGVMTSTSAAPPTAGPPGAARPDRPADITEAPTEAVPVVPTTPPVPRRPAATAVPTRPGLERPSFENPFRVMFDPNRRWLYWIRLALLITASIVLLMIFVWAMGELWDSLGELLDTIGSTESGTDVNGVDPGN